MDEKKKPTPPTTPPREPRADDEERREEERPPQKPQPSPFGKDLHEKRTPKDDGKGGFGTTPPA